MLSSTAVGRLELVWLLPPPPRLHFVLLPPQHSGEPQLIEQMPRCTEPPALHLPRLRQRFVTLLCSSPVLPSSDHSWAVPFSAHSCSLRATAASGGGGGGGGDACASQYRSINAAGVVGLSSMPSALHVDITSPTSVPPITSPGVTPPPLNAATTVCVYGWCSGFPASTPLRGRLWPAEVLV